MEVKQQVAMESQTPFYNEHLNLGAKMVPFGGWSMPLNYGSQVNEHLAVRNRAGMFDVSHMAIVDIQGPQAESFLRKVLANDVAKLTESGRALYGCMLNPEGGIIDDLITYKMSDDHFRVVVNAATTKKDLEWFNQQAKAFDTKLELRSDLGLLAVQGPQARSLFLSCLDSSLQSSLEAIKPFRFASVENLVVARTGYTGEDGFEVMGPHQELISLWKNLLNLDVQPCGLGARDTLRLEAGLNLYGTDMDESTTPLESNLGWTVDFKDSQRDFIGRKALEQQQANGVPRQLVGLLLEGKGVLRCGMRVTLSDGQQGILTSGSYSPSLKRSIGFARLPSQAFETCTIEIRQQEQPARRVSLPFVRQGKICIEL